MSALDELGVRKPALYDLPFVALSRKCQKLSVVALDVSKEDQRESGSMRGRALLLANPYSPLRKDTHLSFGFCHRSSIAWGWMRWWSVLNTGTGPSQRFQMDCCGLSSLVLSLTHYSAGFLTSGKSGRCCRIDVPTLTRWPSTADRPRAKEVRPLAFCDVDPLIGCGHAH
jgi:hypothetical protein